MQTFRCEIDCAVCLTRAQRCDEADHLGACRRLEQRCFKIECGIGGWPHHRGATGRAGNCAQSLGFDADRHQQRLDTCGARGERRYNASRSGSGKYHDALTRREAQVDKMLGKRTHLRVELAVSQGSPCCPRTRFGQRQALRAQLGGSRGERVEAESCDRMLAGKRVCLAHGSFFHHVSSVTLKSGAA
jgi:hypothetical protein